MLDVSDAVSGSAALAVSLLRGLWWLGWDFMIRTVGWSIGWLIWRVVTLGRWPSASIGRLDDDTWRTQLVVELTGLVALAAAVWWLSGSWPRL